MSSFFLHSFAPLLDVCWSIRRSRRVGTCGLVSKLSNMTYTGTFSKKLFSVDFREGNICYIVRSRGQILYRDWLIVISCMILILLRFVQYSFFTSSIFYIEHIQHTIKYICPPSHLLDCLISVCNSWGHASHPVHSDLLQTFTWLSVQICFTFFSMNDSGKNTLHSLCIHIVSAFISYHTNP